MTRQAKLERRMRVWITSVLVGAAFSGVAHTQSSGPAPARWYAEAVAQSAFGNVTSQSYGGEIGVAIVPHVAIFPEGGQVRDASPSTLGANAQKMAGFLSQTQGSVTFQARQPVTFGVLGVRYGLPSAARNLEPYVLVGGGMARVERNVTFTLANTDVTSTIAQYSVVLGSDLAGSNTQGMLTLGGGGAWPGERPSEPTTSISTRATVVFNCVYFVVSGFSRTVSGPPKGGHYVLVKIALLGRRGDVGLST
jgi:hypothetical protein